MGIFLNHFRGLFPFCFHPSAFVLARLHLSSSLWNIDGLGVNVKRFRGSGCLTDPGGAEPPQVSGDARLRLFLTKKYVGKKNMIFYVRIVSKKRFLTSGLNNEERWWKKNQKSGFKVLKQHFDLQIYEKMGWFLAARDRKDLYNNKSTFFIWNES